MSSAAQRISEGALTLAEAPTDFAAWHRLAAALLEAESDLASTAYARMGEAANRLGQVALAIACTCQLRDLDEDKQADELVAAIAKTHARGSSSIDAKLKPSPLAPPPKKRKPRVDSSAEVGLDAALAEAKKALTAASKSVQDIAPPKLPPTPLVSALSRDELRELASVVNHRVLEAESVVIDIGEPATTLFWVARGTLDVSRGQHHLGTLRSNSFFGEIALVGSTDRTARVTAKTDVWVLDIPAESVEKLAGRSPRLAKVLANYARARILSNVMRTSGLFSRLTEDERRALLPRFEARILEAGETLLEGKVANDTLYVIASGNVEVRDGKKVVATLSVGDGVGEQSLLSRKPAAFDVVATTRCAILGLHRSCFDDLAVVHPGLLAEAYKLLVEREQSGAQAVHDAAELVI